jgi:Flp pilus assembly protein CpaB
MRSRGLVVVLAFVLATLATAAVFLYSRGVKEDAASGGSLRTVIVSKVNIPANSDLNALVSDGQFVETQVRADNFVEGAVTQVSELRGRRNSVFILAGEQIPTSRIQGGKVQGGVLSIPEGHQALTVSLGGPRAVGAALAGGDNVTILATFTDVAVQEKSQGSGSTTTAERVRAESATVVLVPTVQVLRVYVPQAAGTSSSDGGGQADVTGNIAVTLSLLPEEAQRFVLALEQGSIYLSLLPPDAEGVQLNPITIDGIINPPKTKASR